MAVTLKPISRKFRFGSVDLPDPDPSIPAESVAEHFLALHPELATASLKGPVMEGESHVYTYHTSLGQLG